MFRILHVIVVKTGNAESCESVFCVHVQYNVDDITWYCAF
jgi:hypothetical protein